MLPADVPALIARIPLFAHLNAAQRAALAEHLRWICLPGGQYLIRAGEVAEALYLLRSGSLGVFDGPTDLIRQISADDCLGEVSLLSGEAFRYNVRALRDSELLRLDRDMFEHLIEQHPRAMLDVARQAMDRLLRRERHAESPDKPRTFAILPVDENVPVRGLAMQLAQALEAYGDCIVIDAEHGATRGSDWFAEREAQARFVIYLDSTGDPSWRLRCLRQADVLLLPALAAQPARPWPESAPGHPARVRHRPRHLLLIHPAHRVLPGSARRWLGVFSGEIHHHHVCGEGDVPRIARLISGHARGLVLAGGGARGLAHLGALRALGEAGHEFDAIGGTSIGAIIGAGVANMWSIDDMTRIYYEAFVRGKPLSDWTLPFVALTRGRRAAMMLRRAFGAIDIEDLERPFFCVSTNLSGEGRVVHRHGPLWLWLRATSSIPGILPPVLHRGHVYVDGALVDNLPTDVMAEDGIAHITAVAIRADIALRAQSEEFATPPWWRLWMRQRRGTGWPGLVSTLTRAAMVNSEETSQHCIEAADLLITPPLEHVSMLDWKDWQLAVDSGYREALRVLEQQARGIHSPASGADMTVAG
ncbi:cyclic nucleotide-binding domain-containing protein [Dyella dinghuensis]|uniref:Cyclic nucleotide-binding domain-containing protein n=1 Tax=Dyella dinghuensis TaxID=1920169 RepID=A0A3S0PBM1_9GAMM|nr:patatin-like phospholipase family protein [Dyella dinghuensis]RUL63343.1 cyclic nucleotide-binding domain-containing protein [Dyella dinghuensis]